MNIAIIIITALLVIALIGFFLFRKRRAGASEDSNNQVYVGNLAYRVSEQHLQELFEPYGQITRLKVVRDSRTRRSKGYGFVSFESETDAQKALAEHGQEYSGRALVVRIAKPR